MSKIVFIGKAYKWMRIWFVGKRKPIGQTAPSILSTGCAVGTSNKALTVRRLAAQIAQIADWLPIRNMHGTTNLTLISRNSDRNSANCLTADLQNCWLAAIRDDWTGLTKTQRPRPPSQTNAPWLAKTHRWIQVSIVHGTTNLMLIGRNFDRNGANCLTADLYGSKPAPAVTGQLAKPLFLDLRFYVCSGFTN